jgi:hypothetical protein
MVSPLDTFVIVFRYYNNGGNFMQKKSIFVLILVAIVVLVSYQLLRYNQQLSDNYSAENKDQSKPVETQVRDIVKTPVNEADYSYRTITYGQSGSNVPLLAYKFSNKNPSKKILCVFAMHGFEDAFYKDGQALVDTANGVIDYFKNNSKSLGTYELIIVPSANPDGLKQGWTCNGPGRCQISQGIDINMDFDYNFRPRVNARNKTGEKPFASPEAVSLRDLVINEKPDIIIDFHGWINCASGDKEIAEVFCNHLGLTYEKKEKEIYDGFFSGWAAKYAKAVLVEYPSPFTGKGSFDGKSDGKYDYTSKGFSGFGYTENTVKAIEEIVEKKM